MSINITEKSVKTTCAYCGVGCGIKATTVDVDKRIITVSGDEDHPANFGRLCSKGSALAETVSLEGRLLHPEVNGQQTDWDSALNHVADKFNQVIAEYGPEAVAFYASGQLLTEDYYVANKLMKGFIGSANIDTNSRLCMSSPVAGHKRAFGTDTVPGNYEDIEKANLLVITGSNTAWCHPIIFQRIRKAKENNPSLKIVVIDPRRTQTCDIADLHLPIKAGTDTLLFNGLLAYLANHGDLDFSYLEKNTDGFGKAIDKARETSPSSTIVAQLCDLDPETVATFYQWFAQNQKTVSLFSQGVNQSSSGTDKVNAIINCHLATGRIGREGMGPFSLTGQPNAMGGREVGGLANQLAAHMDLENPDDVDRVGRFWKSATVAHKAGLKAVDLFDAIHDGKVKAVWIMATNPVVSLPNANKVKEALAKCELVVVSECIAETDTSALAHVKLPASTWAEKDGTVTNSERRISIQRALLPLPGEAKHDWWIISQVGQRMGFKDAFSFDSATDIFREHAALSAFENSEDKALRDFNLSGFADIDVDSYNNIDPIQWPVTRNKDGSLKSTARLFNDGKFFTANKKAKFIAIESPKPSNIPNLDFPLLLNTGRIRDQWHTMTRTGLAPKLCQHDTEPFVEVHPEDAARFKVEDKKIARIKSQHGVMLARVVLTDNQKRGSIFAPMHWTDQLSIEGRVGALVNPVVDPVSGQPDSKHTPAFIEAYTPGWYGFILTRRSIDIPGADYRIQVRGEEYFCYELAGNHSQEDWSQRARDLLCEGDPERAQWIEYFDKTAGAYRGARLTGGHLESCLFVSPSIDLPERNWIATLFLKEQLSDAERASLLTGKPPIGQEDKGKVVCACFGVGENTLRKTINEKGLKSIDDIGQCLKAGTNCGSCVPELKQFLS